MVLEFLVSMTVWGVATTLLRGAIRDLPPADQTWIVRSWVVHAFAWILQILVTRYVFGGGDMFGYHEIGSAMAEAVVVSPPLIREVWVAFLQGDATFSFFLAGGATRSMNALVSLVELFTLRTLWGTAALFTVASAAGKIVVFRVLRRQLPTLRVDALAISVLLVPSYVFWTSAILKETVAVLGVALLLLAVVHLRDGRYGRTWVAVPGAMLAGLIKPYILLVMFVSCAAFAFWSVLVRTGRSDVSVVRALLLLGGVVVGLMALGQIFPEFSFGQIDDTALNHQGVGHAAAEKGKSGSYYSIGAQGGSLGSQLPYVPLALVAGWFRPFLFEARNPVMLVNGAETAVLLGLFLRAIQRLGLAGMVRSVVREPALVLCVVFAVALGTGTGFTSSNLGTLSRYRAPLIPFLSVLLAAWNVAPVRHAARSAAHSRIDARFA